MTGSRQVKAYILDASGQRIPLSVDSLVLEFPSGDVLEVCWEEQRADDPRPTGIEVWGGRRVTEPMTQEDIDAQTRGTSVAFLPAAANVVLVHPYSYPIRPGENEAR